MKALRYSIPFLFLATVPVGFALGGVWSFLTIAVVPACLAGLDWLLGVAPSNDPSPASVPYRVLPWLYIPLQVAVIGWAALEIASPGISSLESVGLTVSVGLTAGIFGMLVAHEMVHSPRALERTLGLFMLASVGYMQFRIAHIHGHHAHAATPEDAATARRDESAYRFILRSALGQLCEAWRFEADRLRRRGAAVLGPANRMLWYFAVEGLVALGAALLDLRSLGFFLAESALAIALLELFNYIAHYGLMRRDLPSGRRERLGPRHSWNSSRRMNNWSLFNMGRHSDHHRLPARPYQCLEALAEAPELPTGYAGAILLALVPPLWRTVMNPRLDLWTGAAADLAAAD